jgi:hypothetical protein
MTGIVPPGRRREGAALNNLKQAQAAQQEQEDP